MRLIIALLLGVFAAQGAVAADSYSCAKMVYASGWLKKYEYLGNTWGANTRRSGIFSSTIHSYLEKSTAMFDPGVTTKEVVSSVQYTSSWGECAAIDYNVTMKMRRDYIEQNEDEIKTEIAMGGGIHVDSLAFVSGCHGINEGQWKKSLQDRAVNFYEQKNADDFVGVLDNMIQSTKEFSARCSLAG